MKLFQWKPSKETIVPFMAGLVIIFLSAAMIPFEVNSWIRIAIHDIGMICLAGILFPLLYIQLSGNNFADFGLTLKNWYVFVPINFILGVLLLILFIWGVPPAGFNFDIKALMKTMVILNAGVFEVIFFYSFQRSIFERAFGIVPAIILSALFYSFHHIGFQPEFTGLFIVGVMYAAIYRIGNSALLLYPFFWGVGASYNVLIQSRKVSTIMYPEIRSFYLSIFVLLIITWVWIKSKRLTEKNQD